MNKILKNILAIIAALAIGFAPTAASAFGFVPGIIEYSSSTSINWVLLQNTCVGSTSAGTVSATVNTTGATMIVVQGGDSGTSFVALSDTAANTFTTIRTDTYPTIPTRLTAYYVTNPITSGSDVFTFTSSVGQPSICVSAWTGNGTYPVDVQSGANGSFSTSANPGSITPTGNNEMVLTSVVPKNDGSSPTVSAGFSVIGALASSPGNSVSMAMAYKIQATPSALNPTWSFATSPYAVNIIAFTQRTYATLDPAHVGYPTTLSGGHLTYSNFSGQFGMTSATIGETTGKWYWEDRINTPSTPGIEQAGIGLFQPGSGNTYSIGGQFLTAAFRGDLWDSTYNFTGSTVQLGSGGHTPVPGTVLGFALDCGARTLKIFYNGVQYGPTITGIPAGTIWPSMAANNYGNSGTANFGQFPFSYTPPVGYNHGVY